MNSYKGFGVSALVFVVFFLGFAGIGHADELVLRYIDGSSQRVRLDKPADAIKSIEFIDARKPIGHDEFTPMSIRIVAGTYGRNCGAVYGNATDHLASICDGRPVCEYIVDVNALGDPARECSKDFVAEWRCGNSPERATVVASPEAGGGKRLLLRCPIR
jgi:hypothetical protein